MGIVAREGGGLKDGTRRNNKCPLQDEEAEELSRERAQSDRKSWGWRELGTAKKSTEGQEVSSA